MPFTFCSRPLVASLRRCVRSALALPGKRTADSADDADEEKTGLTALIRDIRGLSYGLAASWRLAVEAFAAEAGITGGTPVPRWVWSGMADSRGGTQGVRVRKPYLLSPFQGWASVGAERKCPHPGPLPAGEGELMPRSTTATGWKPVPPIMDRCWIDSMQA